MAPYTTISSFDKPRVAAANITRGDVEGTLYSLFSPQSLSPEQRKDWAPEEKGPYSAVMRTVTNPLVIIGVAMFISVAILFVNLLVDISYAYLDPRIQYR